MTTFENDLNCKTKKQYMKDKGLQILFSKMRFKNKFITYILNILLKDLKTSV